MSPLPLFDFDSSLAAKLIDEIEYRHTPVSSHRLLVAENRWVAGRHRLGALLLDLVAGRREQVGSGTLGARRLKRLAPYARALGRSTSRAESSGASPTARGRSASCTCGPGIWASRSSAPTPAT